MQKESQFFLCIFLARSFVRRKLLGPLGHFQIINRCTMGTQFSLPLFAFSIPISSNHKWTGEIHVVELWSYRKIYEFKAKLNRSYKCIEIQPERISFLSNILST